MNPSLPSDEAVARLAALAAAAVERAVAGLPAPDAGTAPAEHGGLVVTLLDARGELRGSVGTSAPGPLAALAADLGRRAALEDPRYPPVRPEELAGLVVEVTVLGAGRPVHDPAEVRPDVDAVRVRRGLHAALLPPSIARDRSWGSETFLVYACRQAGLTGDAFRAPDAVVEAFETRTCRAALPGTAC